VANQATFRGVGAVMLRLTARALNTEELRQSENSTAFRSVVWRGVPPAFEYEFMTNAVTFLVV
jgi:hypothetical protein